MKKNKTKIFGVSFALAAFSFMQNATAQSCITPPTCESLGYKDVAERCEGGAMIKCPFDTSKVFCRKKKYTKVCDTIGDVLLENKLCAYDINDMDPNIAPIGVVIDIERKLAVALQSSSEKFQWSTQRIDIPSLVNYRTKDEAMTDFNGKENTSIIITHGDDNGYETPAADYAYNYTTKGTNKGDWYLPSVGEAMLTVSNRTTLDNSLVKAGGQKLSGPNHWTSCEYDSTQSWALRNNATPWHYQKTDPDSVRPVLAF